MTLEEAIQKFVSYTESDEEAAEEYLPQEELVDRCIGCLDDFEHRHPTKAEISEDEVDAAILEYPQDEYQREVDAAAYFYW